MADLGIIFNSTFLVAVVLILGAFSGYLSERVGIVNVGIDGMMCLGALFFGIFSSPKLGMPQIGPGMIIIPLILSAICTTIFGVAHAFATIKLKANHVISGIAINLIGVALATFLNTPLGPKLFNGMSTLSSGFTDFLYIGNSIYGSSIIIFVLIILLAVGLYVFMKYTRIGLRYRAIGENPNAVDAQGINVYKYQWLGVILSSAIAGLAGALFLFNIKQFNGNVQGMGFLSLAILIAGGWQIEWISIIAICFGTFTSLTYTSVLTNLGIPRAIAFAVPYTITLIVLLSFSKKVKPPAHSGIPFDKGVR